MKATNTFGVRFIVRKNKTRNGTAPIYATVTVNGKRVEISLKQVVSISVWNVSKGIGKGNSQEVIQLNQYLEQIRARLTECYRELHLQQKTITAESIKSLFLGESKSQYSLQMLVNYHNETLKDVLAWGTMKNYYTTQRYITKFLLKCYKVSDINLSELTYQFISDFEFFLRKHEPIDHQKKMTNNGVMKHLERFRKMINLAIKMEWLEKDPFTRYKLRFIKNSREFLSSEELSEIEFKCFKIPRLEYVRDLFVFSCYTGLAYIDAMSLRGDNLGLGIDGEMWITCQRQKTSQPVRIPLLPKALEIVDKYKTHPNSLNRGTIFPNISNQKLNGYLKEIADLCGIKKPLTFHIARHTFATTVTLTNGVPIETVSKLLGHTSIKTTQIYAKIVEQKVSSDMKLLRTALSKRQSGNDSNLNKASGQY